MPAGQEQGTVSSAKDCLKGSLDTRDMIQRQYPHFKKCHVQGRPFEVAREECASKLQFHKLKNSKKYRYLMEWAVVMAAGRVTAPAMAAETAAGRVTAPAMAVATAAGREMASAGAAVMDSGMVMVRATALVVVVLGVDMVTAPARAVVTAVERAMVQAVVVAVDKVMARAMAAAVGKVTGRAMAPVTA